MSCELRWRLDSTILRSSWVLFALFCFTKLDKGSLKLEHVGIFSKTLVSEHEEPSRLASQQLYKQLERFGKRIQRAHVQFPVCKLQHAESVDQRDKNNTHTEVTWKGCCGMACPLHPPWAVHVSTPASDCFAPRLTAAATLGRLLQLPVWCQTQQTSCQTNKHLPICLHPSSQQPQWEPCQTENTLDNITYLGLYLTLFGIGFFFFLQLKHSQLNPLMAAWGAFHSIN